MMKYRIAAFAAACFMTMPGARAAESTEAPPVFRASQRLPASLLRGPNHGVEERVQNDGFMNHYRISSRFGSFQAQSDAELAKRVSEINAIDTLARIEVSDEFAKGLKAAGGNVVEGATSLVTSPVSTVSSDISGVGTLFRRAGDSLVGDPKSEHEDGALKSITGVSQAKRDLAASLGVDVYSSNRALQEALNRVARGLAVGNLTASAALAAVGGGVGTAITVTKTTASMNEVLRTTPPVDLRRRNREMLEGMKINSDVVDLYLGNTVISPTHQSRFVQDLSGLSGAGGRMVPVKLAVRTASDDVAFFRQRQMRMYASYHATVGALERFVPLGDFAAAVTRDGKLVFMLPTDHLAWTGDLAAGTDAVMLAVGQQSLDSQPRELWLGGSLSPAARAAIEARGWRVEEDTAAKLIGTR
jgi:hypothetical protein